MCMAVVWPVFNIDFRGGVEGGSPLEQGGVGCGGREPPRISDDSPPGEGENKYMVVSWPKARYQCIDLRVDCYCGVAVRLRRCFDGRGDRVR